MRAFLIFGPPLHEPPTAPTAPSHAMSTWRTHGASDCFAVAAGDLIERPTVLLIPPGKVDGELCPNEKMAD